MAGLRDAGGADRLLAVGDDALGRRRGPCAGAPGGRRSCLLVLLEVEGRRGRVLLGLTRDYSWRATRIG